MPDATATVSIKNKGGLHFRPAGSLVQLAQQYSCEITITHAGTTVDAKSPIELVTLGAPHGSELALAATGPDAQAAIDAIVALVENRFGMNEAD